MTKAFFFLFFLFSAANALACSMQVDENYTKNLLIAHAASFNDLSLAGVSGISLANYDLSYSTGEANGSCPDYLFNSARVSMNHSPSAFKHCTYSVSVVIKTYNGSDLPDGPIEEVTFIDATAACSSTLSGLKIPRKLPIRIKKPVIVRPFPR